MMISRTSTRIAKHRLLRQKQFYAVLCAGWAGLLYEVWQLPIPAIFSVLAVITATHLLATMLCKLRTRMRLMFPISRLYQIIAVGLYILSAFWVISNQIR